MFCEIVMNYYVCNIKFFPSMNSIEMVHIKNILLHFIHLLPNNEGKDKAAGPGP